MAVTNTEHRTEHRTEVEEPDREEKRGQEAEENRPQEREVEEPRAGEEESDEEESEAEESGEAKEPEKRKRAKGIAGGAAIFLFLGIYFVWIGSEMGSHAISGTFEMWAIFGAIFLGVLALVGGGAISQKSQQKDSDDTENQGR